MARKKADSKARTAAPTPDAATLVSTKSRRTSKAAVAKVRGSDEGTPPEISRREKIALLAYSYWEQRGYQGGSPEEDWYRAERETGLGAST